ncbi:hypothetical protein ACFJIV_28885 [Mucilaginibacter sp. UC70_90]
MPKYKRTELILPYPEFLGAIAPVKIFTSSEGKRYQVTHMRGHYLHFNRLDAKTDTPWDINLEQLYKAYVELEDFKTASFSKYVHHRHSPGRGLLIHLGLLGPA